MGGAAVARPGLRAAFFDIGGTLGTVSTASGVPRLALFPDTLALLRSLRDGLQLRLGVISNIPADMTTAQITTMLDAAGVLALLEPGLVITSADAGSSKPDARIFRYAAQRAGLGLARCLYVGEDAEEVSGALAAGMQALLKPKP